MGSCSSSNGYITQDMVISESLPMQTMDVITCPCPDLHYILLVKGVIITTGWHLAVLKLLQTDTELLWSVSMQIHLCISQANSLNKSITWKTTQPLLLYIYIHMCIYIWGTTIHHVSRYTEVQQRRYISRYGKLNQDMYQHHLIYSI